MAYLKERGHEVLPLGRGEMPSQKAGAIIHLAGENIAGRRWSAQHKKAIYDSRVLSTKELIQHITQNDLVPKVFISASAVGYYGDREDEILTEASSKGAGFLADVCQDWEDASKDLPGARVCHTRFGMVLAKSGGALKKMLPAFKVGLGGRFGSGKQFVSWIGLGDLVRGVEHVLESDLSGPVNFTAPEPVMNKIFTEAVADHVGRWVGPPMPAWIARLVFGEMADSLFLASQRAIPEKLLQSGFVFETPRLQEALEKNP